MSLLFQWIQQLPSIFSDTSNVPRPSIVSDHNNNYYIAYTTVNPSISTQGQTNTGLIDICVVKLNVDGNMVWYRQQPSFDTTQSDVDPSICIDSDNNICVAYYTGGKSSGQSKTGFTDIVVFKLDSDGNTIWVKQSSGFNISGYNYDPVIATDSSNNIWVTYYNENQTLPETYYDTIVIFKLNSNGDLIWLNNQHTINTEGGNYHPSIGVDNNNNGYVAYFCDGGSASGESAVGSFDIIVLKVNSDGNLLWIRQRPTFDTILTDYYPSITVDSNYVYVAYISQGGIVSGQTNTGDADVIIFKMDQNGNTIWVKQQPSFNTVLGDIFPIIDVDSRGYIYTTYNTYGITSGNTSTGSPDVVVCQMDPNGNVVTVIQQPTFNTIFENVYPSISVDSDNNCVVAYYSINQNVGLDDSTQNLIVFKLRNLICVDGLTMITMADGTLKPIKYIQRGDIVAPNHRVSRLCVEPIIGSSYIDIYVFKKNCLGSIPTQDLYITGNHPIFYKGARRPAKCFANCPSVTVLKHINVNQLVTILPSHELYLYDLQFDYDTSYIANGLTVQSRSPNSYYGPLPKELYYDQSLYSDALVWDSSTHEYPLLDQPVTHNLVILKNRKHSTTVNLGDNIINYVRK